MPARKVIEQNIRHYRELLARETDPAKRNAFAKLIATEEAKLATLGGKRPLN